MVDLAIIIVSYNTRHLLGQCLRSIEENLPTAIATELWVVDNSSQDGSAEMVAAEFPRARLLANADNRGFAAANNQALRQCQARYALLLNPDTVVMEGALGELVRFMDSHPSVGVASGQLLNPDGTRQHSCFRFPTLWMTFLDFFPLNHRFINSRLNGRYPWSERPFPIDHPLGACLMARREAIEAAGPLDEGFYMYCEEIDWCLRIKRAGWQIYCVPQARFIHYGGESTRQRHSAMLVELHRSRYRLFHKHYSRRFQWANRQIVRLGLAREALRARWQAWRGQLSGEELRERLTSYQQIAKM